MGKSLLPGVQVLTVFRRVLDTIGEGRGYKKTLKDISMKMTSRKTISPQPEGGKGSKIVLFNLVGIYNE